MPYFRTFPGVWHHGDYVEITPRGGVIVYGRSDATLNPGGVRIGTAEIYRQVETLDEVDDALVVGQQWNGDTRAHRSVRGVAGRPATRRRPGRQDQSRHPHPLHAAPRAGQGAASPRRPPARSTARKWKSPSPASFTAKRCATATRSPTPNPSTPSGTCRNLPSDAWVGLAAATALVFYSVYQSDNQQPSCHNAGYGNCCLAQPESVWLRPAKHSHNHLIRMRRDA